MEKKKSKYHKGKCNYCDMKRRLRPTPFAFHIKMNYAMCKRCWCLFGLCRLKEF